MCCNTVILPQPGAPIITVYLCSDFAKAIHGIGVPIAGRLSNGLFCWQGQGAPGLFMMRREQGSRAIALGVEEEITRPPDRNGAVSGQISSISPTSVLFPNQANPHKLPACVGREKVTIRWADMRDGGCTGAAAQDELVAHELAVVFP